MKKTTLNRMAVAKNAFRTFGEIMYCILSEYFFFAFSVFMLVLPAATMICVVITIASMALPQLVIYILLFVGSSVFDVWWFGRNDKNSIER